VTGIERITITLSVEAAGRVRCAAEAERRSVSNWIALAVDAKLAHDAQQTAVAEDAEFAAAVEAAMQTRTGRE